MDKIAIVLGATGLVGKQLVKVLLANSDIKKVKIIGRRASGVNHTKAEDILIDFDDHESWKNKIQGDIAFAAFGTTIKKAGSKQNQYKIDYTYQYEYFKAASQNGVEVAVLVSAAGANANSALFYNRIKGELDRDIQKLNFKTIGILRPSLLLGDRTEKRSLEKFSMSFLQIINFIPLLRKYRPIKDHIVAEAMLNIALKLKGIQLVSSDQIFKLARLLK